MKRLAEFLSVSPRWLCINAVVAVCAAAGIAFYQRHPPALKEQNPTDLLSWLSLLPLLHLALIPREENRPLRVLWAAAAWGSWPPIVGFIIGMLLFW